MLYIVIAYLWASICLYILLGGADFGAGIVELVSKPKHRKTVRNIMYDAIGPIWEANHMWLIIAIVILFVGFPEIYTTMSVYMHIPLVLMLLGIIARGTAFAFRHYDAVTDEMQTVYSRVFTLSSLITPFFLGIIAAATVSRTIDTAATDFLSAYVYSWLNPFGVTVGFFTVAICGYLAAVFAVGQTADAKHQRMLVRLARAFIVIAVACGGAVFLSAYHSGIPLVNWIVGDLWGQLAVLLASLSLVALFVALNRRSVLWMRLLAGFQVVMILFAATYRHYPHLILLKNGGDLSLTDHHGGLASIDALGWALVLGSIFILPALFYLMYAFRGNRK